MMAGGKNSYTHVSNKPPTMVHLPNSNETPGFVDQTPDPNEKEDLDEELINEIENYLKDVME